MDPQAKVLNSNIRKFTEKVAVGEFNAKSSNWFCQDKTSLEGEAFENLIS